MTLNDEKDAPVAMSDEELCSLIDGEVSNSVGFNDAFSNERRKALYYYMGEAKEDLAPPEIDGRSQVVSKDIMDTVEWIMPSLMRIFAGSESVVQFEATKPGQEKGASDATQYAAFTLFRRNHGFRTLHDTLKTALIQRIGFVKVFVEQDRTEAEETYDSLTDEELQALKSDPSVEVTDEQPYTDALGAPLHRVVAMRTLTRPMIRVVGVPPEEVRVNREARTDEDVRFIAHERELTLSDLRALGYDEDKIEQIPSDTTIQWTQEGLQRDTILDLTWKGTSPPRDESQRTVRVIEAYYKVDADKDGIAEWRCIHKAGTTLLVNEECDDHAFATCSPILMPYRLPGLSIYDLLSDLQRINTALQRQMLDNLYLINNARTEVVQGQVDLDDLLNPRPGGIVRVKAPGMMREIAPTPVIDQSLAALQYFSASRQRRSGVTEYQASVQPESIGDNKSGVAIDLLQSAQRERVELIARVIGETFIKRLYRLILKAAIQHGDHTDQVMVNGSFLQMNPREWSTGYDLSVSVGLGSQSRQAQAAQMQQIMLAQKELSEAGLVKPEHVANAFRRWLEAVGFKNSSEFIIDPTKEAPQPPQQETDPNVALAQAEMQKAQLQAQTDQAKIQASLAEKQADIGIKREQLAIERMKLEIELQRLNHDQQRDTRKLDIDAYKTTADVEGAAHQRATELAAPMAEHITGLVQQLAQAMDEVKAHAQAAASPKRRMVKVVRDERGDLAGAEVVDA